MTDKQQIVYDGLTAYEEETGGHPTVRQLADSLEAGKHRSARFSYDEVRGHLERLEVDGYVTQYRDEGDRVRYKTPIALG